MKRALVLIDIQNDYLPNGNNELENSTQAAENAKMLLNKFRISGETVIHIQHISTREGANFFLPNTQGAEIYPLLSPLADEKVIQKNFPNSFRNTELLDYLKANGIDTLVLCGMQTQMCLEATTRAAYDLGFACSVVSDACATKALNLFGETISAANVHKAALASLNGLYARVMKLEEFE